MDGGEAGHPGVAEEMSTPDSSSSPAGGDESFGAWCTVENLESFFGRITRDGPARRTRGHNVPCTTVGNCTRSFVSRRISPV